MNLRVIFIFAVMWLTGLVTCRADTWLRAEIYLVDWDLRTRASLTPQQVREMAKAKCTLLSEAPDVAKFLSLHDLKPSKDKRPEDARLVIDLYPDTKARITFYASQFNLCSSDSASKRAIGGKFRKHFTLLTKSP